ncbi:MAG: enoyl-CoA hydratase [Desulfobacteraceae bacterium]|nr:enoyl-CoA hydratase [Desulfobacteraceae bacterium]MCB9494234.1 enoyl-CoA hydratase [Desulfobacteraceae bacterium]
MQQAVEFSVHNNIGIITLNRPERKNAINQELLAGLYKSVNEIAENDEIKVGIITGNGDSFCSGIDLKALQNGENLFDPIGDQKGMVEVFKSCKKPIIGAVNGYAITGGFEIALNCDFLIASENAFFRDTHAVVGIHPGWGMSQLLPQAVGRRMAKQMSMTCEPVSAKKALECGLVNEVVCRDDLMKRAVEIAEMITGVNHNIMMQMKELSEKGDYLSFDECLREEEKGFKKFVSMFSK